jgi:hypothetical protein
MRKFNGSERVEALRFKRNTRRKLTPPLAQAIIQTPRSTQSRLGQGVPSFHLLEHQGKLLIKTLGLVLIRYANLCSRKTISLLPWVRESFWILIAHLDQGSMRKKEEKIWLKLDLNLLCLLEKLNSYLSPPLSDQVPTNVKTASVNPLLEWHRL